MEKRIKNAMYTLHAKGEKGGGGGGEVIKGMKTDEENGARRNSK